MNVLKRKRRFLLEGCGLFFLVTIMFSIQVPLWAQSGNGNVRGTVQDASKAVIPAVEVLLTNLSTNGALKAQTNEAGIFTFPSVPPGQYQLVAEVVGMEKYQANLTVQVLQTLFLDVVLKIKSEGTVLEVLADATPLVVSDNSSLGHTLDRQRIEQLPINGRSIMNLLTTTPGLDPNGTRASGMMVGTSDFVLDGAALSDPLDGAGTLVRPPSLDTIQEFNVNVNSSSAKYTRPTTVVMSTKGGGNIFHGTLFETNRNNAYGVARTRDKTVGTKPTFLNRNEYGGTAGGPVFIPKVYNGKDKTFWFFAFEALKERNPKFITGKVPTMAMRQGDFRELKDNQGRLYKIYDPFTTDPVTWNRQQASYNGQLNMFDPSRISPLAAYMFSVIPEPTFPDRNPLLVNNFEGVGRQFRDQWTTTLRIDHRISDRDQFYARYTQGNQNAMTSTGGSPAIPLLDEVANFTRRPNNNKSLALSWNRTFSPTFFNEVMTSGSRENSFGVSGDPNLDYLTQLGLPNPFGTKGFPTVISSIGMGTANYFQGYNTKAKWFNYFIVDDNATKIMGKHELQFGAHFRYDQLTILPQQRQAGGAYSFSDASITGLFDPSLGVSNPQALTRTGHQIANVFLGLNRYQLYMRKGKYYLRAHENAFYLQDNYKLTSRLTLNLGVRWQLTPFPTEKYNVRNGFDLASKTIVLGQPLDRLYEMGVTLPSIISRQEALGAKYTTYDKVGLPKNMVHNKWFDIGPHLGFAYRALDGAKSFVIRGGYSIAYYPDPYFAWNDNNLGSAPFSSAFENNIYSNAAFSPDGLPRYGMRSVPALIAGRNSQNAIDLNNPSSISRGSIYESFFDPDYPTSRVHNWNFTLEKEVMKDTLARASFVANRGLKQSQMWNLNDPTPQFVYQMTSRNPMPTGEYSGVALQPLDSIVYGGINQLRKTGHSNYSGVQLELEKRYSKGFGYQLSYVIGNSYRDSVGGYAPGGGGGWEAVVLGSNQFMPGMVPENDNARNHFLNYQRDFSVPKHQFRWNWIVDIPVGKGKWIAGNPTSWRAKILDTLVGGWQVSGMGVLNTSWFRISDNGSTSLYGASGSGNGNASLWPTGNKIEYYGYKYPIQDCTSGTCLPGYLWWNGYIPPNQINTPDGIMGVPADYKPAVAPLIPWGSTTKPANFPEGKNLEDYWDSSTTFFPLNNGEVAELDYAPGIQSYQNQYAPGPRIWNMDASLSKEFKIKEQIRFRFNLDAFNVFNHPNTDITNQFYMDNGIMYTNTQLQQFGGARTLQLSMRLIW